MLIFNCFIVRQNQPNETLPTDPVDVAPYDQFSTEGQALSGPFKVPSDVLKKQNVYGNCSRHLIINPPKNNIALQKLNYSNNGSNVIEIDESKNTLKEKRKPTVSKNTKPKQQVI